MRNFIVFIVVLFIVAIPVGFVTLIVNGIRDDKEISTFEAKITKVDERISNINGNINTIHAIYVEHMDGKIEVLESRDNLIQGKFNNMELILECKKHEGDTVLMTVAGFGKSWLFDYRNVIKVEQLKED